MASAAGICFWTADGMTTAVTVPAALQMAACTVFLLKAPILQGIGSGNEGLFLGPATHGVLVHLLVALMAPDATC
jgi:hypothetical protein